MLILDSLIGWIGVLHIGRIEVPHIGCIGVPHDQPYQIHQPYQIQIINVFVLTNRQYITVTKVSRYEYSRQGLKNTAPAGSGTVYLLFINNIRRGMLRQHNK